MSCSTTKQTIKHKSSKSLTQQTQSLSHSSTTSTMGLEGEQVIRQVLKDNGVEMVEALSEDGLSIRKVAYRWFSGTYTADNKTVAIEIARREAMSTVVRVINTIVQDKAEKGTIAVSGKVQDAIKSYWRQQSQAIMSGCEAFGDVVLEYNPTTKMYTALAKVAMRGDRFNKAVESAGTNPPKTLSQEELNEFVSLNNSIIEAAKNF